MRRLLSAISLLLSCVTAAHAGETGASPVTRAVFTTGIQQAEPVDTLSELRSGAEQVFLFTELRGMRGEVLVHTWEYKGSVIARIHLPVEQPDARVWSGRLLTPDLQGSWRVVITNAAGTVLGEKTLDYNPDDLSF